MADDFRLLTLSTKNNPYRQLQTSIRFEDLTEGRQGTVLVKPVSTRGTPIVRTTSKYRIAAQCFHPVHVRLAEQIRAQAQLKSEFNNALIERYTNAYFKMGAHSDQALDLEDESHIALFSCYEHPERATPPRTLKIVSKEDQNQTFEIALAHNSVIVFSLETNRRFAHKIVLDRSGSVPENTWLGITYRTSKTFVTSYDGQTHFEDGTPLTLANNEQAREFYKLRGQENRDVNFTYPPIRFTLSESDLLPPTRCRE